MQHKKNHINDTQHHPARGGTFALMDIVKIQVCLTSQVIIHSIFRYTVYALPSDRKITTGSYLNPSHWRENRGC